MKFSIIMPTFNRPELINRSIISILNQNYKDWELIIQNGGEKLYLPYEDKRIKLFNEKDSGITDAMNRGMKRATGDVFCWCNDNDEMAEGTLKWVSENLEKDWGYGLINMTDGNGGHLWGDIRPERTLQDLLGGNFVPQPSVFWTRKAYEEVGEMSKDHDLTSDYDYWIRLWKFQEPQKFERVMADYNLHPKQIGRASCRERV